MRRFSAFSLMEMMVVLLIVAIIAAASAPMVSKKMSDGSTGEIGSDCHWLIDEADPYSISYNQLEKNNKSVIIGAKKTNEDENSTTKPRLYIKTKDATNNPQIALDDNNNTSYLLHTKKKSFWFSSNKPTTEPTDSVVIGHNSSSGNYGVAIGSDSTVAQIESTAIGYKAQASGTNNSTAIGHSAEASGTYSTAVGGKAKATEIYATALGYNTNVKSFSTAMGSEAEATGSSVAIGREAKTNINSVAIGYKANENVNLTGQSVAIGAHTKASSGTAIGYYANSSEAHAIAIGNGLNKETAPKALSLGSIAIGHNTKAGETLNAIAIGKGSKSDGVAIGDTAVAEGQSSIALGYNATANFGATAIGYNAQAGNNGTAIGGGDEVKEGEEGIKTSAGSRSTAIGYGADASSHSTAIGYKVKASSYSTAIGEEAEATGSYSTAIGYGAKATKKECTAIGYNAQTSANAKREIVIGSEKSIVYIPGNLVVNKHAVLGRNMDDSNGNVTVFRALNKDENRTALVRLRYGVIGGGMNQKPYGLQADYSDYGYEWGTGLNNGNDVLDRYPPSEGDIVESDRRLKNVGEVFKGGLEEIKKLEVFNYVYKKDKNKTPRVGVMAQDLQKIFPNAVFKGDDGFLRIRMEDMFYALINAVKELDKKIDLLTEKQKKIDELEKRVEVLEKRVAELEKIAKKNKSKNKKVK